MTFGYQICSSKNLNKLFIYFHQPYMDANKDDAHVRMRKLVCNITLLFNRIPSLVQGPRGGILKG